ncbi:MAG: hypothetical protein KDC98_18110 [Planctomycetes bacterium]|nr:hypothetical protein [Planctomycetota bacterium]
MTDVPSLGARLRPLALLGLAIGLIRYGLEFMAPGVAMFFGVYYVMPIAFLVIGIRRQWGPIRWPAVLGTMALLCLIVWGITNTLAYTTGQFLEWNHGRFYNGGPSDPDNRAAPIAATALGKIGWGLLQGVLTSVAGTIWCTLWGTVVIWLPAKFSRR